MGAPTELGTERIRKLLPRFAVPAIIGMTASSLYNMLDSIFIGQGCGPLAIAGLAVTFPFMNLSAAFGAMIGVGASTVIGVKMGQRDYKGAENAMGNVVVLNVVLGLIFMGVSLIFLEPILRFFGASDETLPYAAEYMRVLLYGNVLTHLYLGLNDVVRASGHPRKAMAATLTAVTVNALFNYYFIFVLDLGIKGAAMGTLCAQFVAFCIVVHHLMQPTQFLHFKRGIFKVRRNIVRQILNVGMAPLFMHSCACFVVMILNNSLRQYGGDLYIGAYGICNRILFIFVMVVNGLNQGMQPIVSYNYGAGNYARFVKTYKFTVMCATAVMTFSFVLAELLPRQLVSWFTTDVNLIDISESALRIMMCVFPLVGFQIVSVGFFTAMGKAQKSIFLSLSRQLLFLLPCLLILPRFFGVEGIWWAMPASDFISVLVVFVLVRRELRNGAAASV